MKTLKLIGLLIMFASMAYSQEVPREKVVVEIGTGTW
jgi:hypothetical protein